MPKSAAAVVANVSTPAQSPAFELLPVEVVTPSPLNPRKTFDQAKHAELVESVRGKGVIVPVMVRPRSVDAGAQPIAYELVYGERRYRAAKEAGLTHLPAIVRSIDDREVLELAITENVSRNDMTPLEEGGAYKKLQGMGRSVEEIAALVGKTKATVYGRMKLAELVGEARKAVEGGELLPTIGVLIARLPTVEMQDEALEILCNESPDYCGGLKALTFETAEEVLQDQFALKLKDAPFDTKDADLVPAAGACIACPKRTGAQPELFKDVKADTCLDRPCHQSKVKAHAAKAKVEIKAKAEKQGLEVLPTSALKSKDYVDLQKEVRENWNSAEKSIKTILGKHAPDPVAVVIDGEGRAHQLVKRADARKALEKAGKKNLAQTVAPAPQKESQPHDYEADRRKQQEEMERRRAVAAEAIGRIVESIEKSKETPVSFLRMALNWFGADSHVLARRGFKDERAQRAAADKMTEPQLRGLLMETILSDDAYRIWNGFSHEFSEACDAFDVDLKKLEAEHKQKAKDAEKAAAKPEEKKPAPAKKAKKGKAA